MKTLKYLTICFVVCCLFSSFALGQCFVGINPNINATLNDSSPAGPVATEGVVGDTIYYFINITIPTSNCRHEDISGYLTLPDDTTVNLPAIPDLNPGESFDFGLATVGNYVIDLGDLGSQPGADGDEVRTEVNLFGTAIRDPADPNFDQPAEGFSTFDTRVIDPESCIEIDKVADCEFSKVGDIVTYTYTITNCGETDLDITSVIDDKVGDITALAEAACDLLPPGESCIVAGVPYTVLPGDDSGEEGATLVNVVTVIADGVIGDITFEEVSDSDDAVVTLLHPDFTVDVECEVPEEGEFSILIVNTGDAPLIVDSCLGVDQLLPGESVSGSVFEDLVEGDICGLSGEASYTCNATATIPLCELPNVLERSDTDTCEIECEPSFTVEKTCITSPLGGDCALRPGDMAIYEVTITNTSTGDCDPAILFDVDDPGAVPSSATVGPLAKGISETITFEVLVPDCPDDENECVDLLNVVTVTGTCVSNGEVVDIITEDAICEYSCGDPEGCTPGFWKNHPDCWCDDYTEDTLVSDVWTRLQSPPYDTLDDGDRKSDFDTDTLADALRYRGGEGLAGKARNMLRHATAALLNSCSTDVGYPLSVQFIIDAGNDALDSEDPAVIQDTHMILAGLNEDSPCPIDAHCRVKDPNDLYD